MARNSFRDAATGVLKAHGFMEANGAGDIKQSEAEDFNLDPGKWKWNGSAWVVVVPSGAKSQRQTDVEAAQAKIDDAGSDNAIPKKIRDALTAIKKVLS